MSAWRRSLQAIYSKGPGLYAASEFDTFDCPLDAAQRGLYRCVERGYIASHPSRAGSRNIYLYQITQLGLDLIEGRAAVVPAGPTPGRASRGGYKPAATWLASLPPTNTVRITSHLQEWAP